MELSGDNLHRSRDACLPLAQRTKNFLAGDAEWALHARVYGLASIQASSASCSPDNLDAPALRLWEQVADRFPRFPDMDGSGDRLRDFVKQEVLGEQSGHVKQERQCTMNVPAAPANLNAQDHEAACLRLLPMRKDAPSVSVPAGTVPWVCNGPYDRPLRSNQRAFAPAHP